MQRGTLFALTAGLAVLAAATHAEEKAGPKDNTPPPGFTALFNGKDLTGWQGVLPLPKRTTLKGEELAKAQKEADAKVLPHWTVQDGVLVNDGKGDNLQTVKDFGDFELYIDWKIQPKGDSGVYLRGQPQVQIWDSDETPGARGEDKGSGSGGLWNNPPGSKGKVPTKKADKPVGEWNTFHITMVGDKVTVELNGVKVVDEAPLANFWDKGKPLPPAGPIELQKHDGMLWFKNIYIREMVPVKG